jgi:alpha-tubulin suppressor-like RCC1 family protein
MEGGDEAEGAAADRGESTADRVADAGVLALPRLAVGDDHACVIRSDDERTLCFGNNAWDQLGNGVTNFAHTPEARSWVPVLEYVDGMIGPEFHGAVSVMAGQDYSCLLRADIVHCWGYGSFGWRTDDVTPDAAATRSPLFDQIDHGRILSLSAGTDDACAIGEKATLCWGRNSFGCLQSGLADSLSVTAIAPLAHVRQIGLGLQFSVALSEGGTVLCWGRAAGFACGNQPLKPCPSSTGLPLAGPDICVPDPTPVPGVPPSRFVAVGSTHVCAIGTDGRVRCWGANEYGEVAMPPVGPCGRDREGCKQDVTVVDGVENADELALGTEHSCALRSGRVLCWGSAAWSGTGISMGSIAPTPVLTSDGSELSEIVQISVRKTQSCAIDANDDVYCWGAGLPYDLDGSTADPLRLRAVKITW